MWFEHQYLPSSKRKGNFSVLKGNWNSLCSSHGIIVILLFLYPLTRILLPFLLYPSLETNILHTGWTTNDLRIWIIDLMTKLCKITKSKEFLLWSSSTNEIHTIKYFRFYFSKTKGLAIFFILYWLFLENICFNTISWYFWQFWQFWAIFYGYSNSRLRIKDSKTSVLDFVIYR